MAVPYRAKCGVIKLIIKGDDNVVNGFGCEVTTNINAAGAGMTQYPAD